MKIDARQRSLTFVRAMTSLVLVLALASCAARVTARYAAPDPAATLVPIYIATQRELDRTGTIFGQPRPKSMNYFRNIVSIPPNHVTGRIEWDPHASDASNSFVVVDTDIYSGLPQMNDMLRRGSKDKEALVYIHGYNNTLSDAMFRLAQIRHDFELKMPSVLFAWASAGDARGYIYDRDSILYARDDLKRTLDGLTSRPGEKVLLIAHSMGAQLTMEVLRQAAIGGDRRLLSRISGVVLISPDIDPEIFRRQAETIGRLPQPFIIFASREDRALGLASFLTGRKPRLGVIDSPDKVRGLGVTLVDFTALGTRNAINHDIPVSSPAAVSLLRGMISQAQDRNSAFDRYMVLGAQPCNSDDPTTARLPVTGLPVPKLIGGC